MSPYRAAEDAWLAAATTTGGGHWLAHARCTVQTVHGAGRSLPVTGTKGTGPLDSYVHSARSAWVRYAVDEAITLLPPAWRRLGEIGFRTALAPIDGMLVASGLDDALIANNWLISTNLHPQFDAQTLSDLEDLATQSSRPLLMRNITDAVNPGLSSLMRRRDWILIPARRVWLADLRGARLTHAHNLRTDQKLLAKPGVEIVPHEAIQAADLPALRQLFRALFIEKHSVLNPDFTDAFFSFCLASRFLEFHALRHQGVWCGVVGLYDRGGWLTTPLLGYDTRLPGNLGLYRRLMALVAYESHRRDQRLHYSSGASQFKQMRGGESALEWTACFARHLPLGKRSAVQAFAQIMKRALPPLLAHYG